MKPQDKNTQSTNDELINALSSLLQDHKRMFPEAHPYSTIAWEECEEVKVALAALAKAEVN